MPSGLPVLRKPSYELLGELLLKENRNAAAREAFEASLQRAPQRTASLLGLARAASAMGDKTAAAEAYRQLLRIWKNADSDYGLRDDVQRSLLALSHAAN